MAEFISGPLPDSLAEQAQGSDAFQSTTGEVLGAEASNAWNSSHLIEGIKATGRAFANGTALSQGDGQYVSPQDVGIDPTANQVHPDDANAQAKQAGAQGLNFSTPMDQSSVKSIIDDHVAAQQRASVIDKRAGGIMTGGLARFGVDSLVGLADPLNIAAMFVPGAPEAFVAEKLGLAADGIATRAITGATQGAAGMAALTPLDYALSKSDMNDFSLGDTLRNIAFGAALGGGLHAGLGALFPHAAADPEVREGAMKAAIAQVVEGRPVDVAPILEHAEATASADALERWHGQQERILSDSDAALQASEVAAPPDRSAVIAQHENTLAQMREQAAQLRGEIEDVQSKRVVEGMDAETSARLDDINQELGGVIPKARRAALEQERTMLMEGRGSLDLNTGDDLEQARNTAQIKGLQQAAFSNDMRAGQVAKDLEDLKAKADAEEADAAARRTSADRGLRIAQANIDSREAVLQNLMEREVRRYAARVGVDLGAGEATTIAKEIRTAQPREVQDTIAAHLNDLAKRSTKPDIQAAVARQPVQTTTGTLRAEAAGAAQDAVQRAREPAPDPEIVRAQKANAATIETAPKFDGTLDEHVAEATKLAQEAHEALQVEIAAGRLQDPEAPPGPKLLGAEWLNSGGSADAMAKEISAAVMRGDKVAVVTEDGTKRADLQSVTTKTVNGERTVQLRDREGNSYTMRGSAEGLSPKDGVEITTSAKDPATAELKAAYDAADAIQAEGKAAQAAAACLASRGF